MEDSASYWDRQARRYDRATLLLNRRFVEMARRVTRDLAPTDAVLEVAAGTGLITAAAAPQSGRYVATDISPRMLELLQHRLGQTPGLETRCADVSSLDFPTETFDVVVAGNLLHLVSDVSTALAEIRRVLRPGGLLIAPTFCHGENLLSRGVSRILGLTGFPLERRLTGAELESMISASGFQIHGSEWFSGMLPIRYVAAKKER